MAAEFGARTTRVERELLSNSRCLWQSNDAASHEYKVQRRRAKLELELLMIHYSLDISRFGWHKIDFLISTEKGKTRSVADALLKRDEIVYVANTIGEHTIDLR